jgi:hypothetical protein
MNVSAARRRVGRPGYSPPWPHRCSVFRTPGGRRRARPVCPCRARPCRRARVGGALAWEWWRSPRRVARHRADPPRCGQRGGSPGPAGVARDSARTLTPVLVTVLRTPFRLDRAPYALNALTPSELQRGRQGSTSPRRWSRCPACRWRTATTTHSASGSRCAVRRARAVRSCAVVRILVDGIRPRCPTARAPSTTWTSPRSAAPRSYGGRHSAVYGNAAAG